GAEVRQDGSLRGTTPLTLPDVNRARGVTLEISKSGYGAKLVRLTHDAPQTIEVSLEPVSDPARLKLGRIRHSLDVQMQKRGIVAGDVASLDAQRSKLASLARRSQFAEACVAGERALAIVKQARVNRKLVMRKLDRFNRAFDEPSNRKALPKLRELAQEISFAVDDGDFETANRKLNRAFELLGSTGP
ncbi:hypothetical protein ACFL6C_07940, partial [Myxococcota bacterium]